jgi:hypothetical protein
MTRRAPLMVVLASATTWRSPAGCIGATTGFMEKTAPGSATDANFRRLTVKTDDALRQPPLA